MVATEPRKDHAVGAQIPARDEIGPQPLGIGADSANRMSGDAPAPPQHGIGKDARDGLEIVGGRRQYGRDRHRRHRPDILGERREARGGAALAAVNARHHHQTVGVEPGLEHGAIRVADPRRLKRLIVDRFDRDDVIERVGQAGDEQRVDIVAALRRRAERVGAGAGTVEPTRARIAERIAGIPPIGDRVAVRRRGIAAARRSRRDHQCRQRRRIERGRERRRQRGPIERRLFDPDRQALRGERRPPRIGGIPIASPLEPRRARARARVRVRLRVRVRQLREQGGEIDVAVRIDDKPGKLVARFLAHHAEQAERRRDVQIGRARSGREQDTLRRRRSGPISARIGDRTVIGDVAERIDGERECVRDPRIRRIALIIIGDSLQRMHDENRRLAVDRGLHLADAVTLHADGVGKRRPWRPVGTIDLLAQQLPARGVAGLAHRSGIAHDVVRARRWHRIGVRIAGEIVDGELRRERRAARRRAGIAPPSGDAGRCCAGGGRRGAGGGRYGAGAPRLWTRQRIALLDQGEPDQGAFLGIVIAVAIGEGPRRHGIGQRIGVDDPHEQCHGHRRHRQPRHATVAVGQPRLRRGAIAERRHVPAIVGDAGQPVRLHAVVDRHIGKPQRRAGPGHDQARHARPEQVDDIEPRQRIDRAGHRQRRRIIEAVACAVAVEAQPVARQIQQIGGPGAVEVGEKQPRGIEIHAQPRRVGERDRSAETAIAEVRPARHRAVPHPDIMKLAGAEDVDEPARLARLVGPARR